MQQEAICQRAAQYSLELSRSSHRTAENKAYLRQLVDKIPLQLGDLKVVLVHGSPRKGNEYLKVSHLCDFYLHFSTTEPR